MEAKNRTRSSRHTREPLTRNPDGYHAAGFMTLPTPPPAGVAEGCDLLILIASHSDATMAGVASKGNLAKVQ